MRRSIFVLLILIATGPGFAAEEPVDLDAVTRIRDEGFHRSQVMDMAQHLTDHIGPRLTGSPQLKAANEWTLQKLEEIGLDGRLEAYDFDHGWSYQRSSLHMVAPQHQTLFALPEAWTPGTDGPVRGRAVRVKIESEEDFEKYRGQLQGAILLRDDVRVPEQIEGELFSRYSQQQLEDYELYEIPDERRGEWRARYRKMFEFWPKLAQFLIDEGVVAMLEVSSRDNGVVRVDRGGSQGMADFPAGVPALVVAAEQYNRLVRLVDDGVDVELEIDVATTFHRDDPHAYNTIADWNGTDLADEIVMVGGHLDSWHGGTGATDNGGNCTVVIEAVRILKAAGLQPRRTIRVAFWSGEEQGYKGSRAYVKEYVATRPEPTDPEQLALPESLRKRTWPIIPLAGHAKLSAYFNIDNGVGRIRGINTQENAAVRPIFEAWLEPLHDLGATTVAVRDTGGTDHQPFDWVGIPAFQFIQDDLDYMTRTHHAAIDTFDHLPREDMMQSAVVLATFLWHAANRDEMLPRKPIPQQPPEEREPTEQAEAPAKEHAPHGNH
jgi:hypothetical protein